MRKNLFLIRFSGYVFVSVLGTLFHFLYDWTGKSIIVASFTAINESIFEHVKLVYFPLLLWTVIEVFIFKGEFKSFWYAKAKAFTVGLLLIPVLYYSYTGALGVYADWLNILIFFISGAVAFLVDTKALKDRCNRPLKENYYKAYVLILGVILIIFTFFPFDIPFFRE